MIKLAGIKMQQIKQNATEVNTTCTGKRLAQFTDRYLKVTLPNFLLLGPKTSLHLLILLLWGPALFADCWVGGLCEGLTSAGEPLEGVAVVRCMDSGRGRLGQTPDSRPSARCRTEQGALDPRPPPWGGPGLCEAKSLF